MKWTDVYSRPFKINQGVLQGSGISPDAFKPMNDDTLVEVSERHIGAKIGTNCVAVPTFADDMAVAVNADNGDKERVIGIVERCSNKNRIPINCSKTTATIYKNSEYQCNIEPPIFNNLEIKIEDEATHLGVLQGPVQHLNQRRIKERTKKATGALYQSMGAGMYGRNGLNPVYIRRIWNSIVIPTLLYGTELWSMTDKEMSQLETWQTKKLKQLQDLPERTGSPAALALIGVLPIQAEVDKRTAILIRNILSKPQSIEYRIALRQLALKGPSSNSWLRIAQNILQKYDLPDAHALLQNPFTKHQWSKKVKTTIHNFWNTKNSHDAEKLPSLRYMSHVSLDLSMPAPLWSTAKHTRRETNKARIKAKVLSGSYMLQTHHALFNKGASAKCQLCNGPAETRQHFVIDCPSLDIHRKPHLDRIHVALAEYRENTKMSKDELLQLILDPTHNSVPTRIRDNIKLQHQLHQYSRDLIFKIHLERTSILNDLGLLKMWKKTKQTGRSNPWPTAAK